MNEAVIREIRRVANLLRTRVPLSGSEWANQHFYLSPESSGTEGRWTCYPYQVALLNWMTSDDIEEVNLQKSRRVGYTKCLLAATGCLIEQKNRNVAIWHPTDGDARDFVTDEVDTVLRDVPLLGAKLKCAVGAKSKFNTVEKKGFHGATLDVKGGKSARNFRRMTKDVAIYDETDGFDVDIDGEGNCFELGDGRLDQAPFPKSIRGSTPKTKGLSLIEAALASVDMVFYRFVRCPLCKELQRLEFARLRWEAGQPDTAWYECQTGCRLEYRHYPTMDARGRWQTLDGIYYVEGRDHFCDPDGGIIPKPRRIGVRIWAGYSYLRPWSYVVDRWLVASKNAKTGNITTLKAVVNTLLGETFEERGESVSPTILGRRGEDYPDGDGRIPNEICVVTAGADVQGGANARIEVEFVGHGQEGETWSLDYVVLEGDPTRQDVWDHLDEQLLRRFIRQDGVDLGVSCAFVDSGYLATAVYRFTAPRRRRNVFATKGVTTGTICNKGTWQGDKRRRSRAILRTVNVDDAKTIIFNRLRIQEPGPGFCHFPGHYPDTHFVRLTNEEKLEKRRAGVVVGFEWRKKGPNEQLDCRAYALGAFGYLNPNMARMRLRLAKQAASLAGGGEEKTVASDRPSEQIIKRRRRVARGAKKGFVNRWK
jgi:phage terminase large subunit GpA-like protein